MFRIERRKSPLSQAFGMLELIHHATVRLIRQSQRNPVLGLLKNILRTVILVAVFYLMITLLGGRPNAIRGDFVLYLMSGVFLYMTHTRAMGAVFDSEGPTSSMMLHAPMNTVIAICSAALSSLYLQFLSMVALTLVIATASAGARRR